MRRLRLPYYYGGRKLGDFEAEQCPSCCETEFTDAAREQISRKARENGVITASAQVVRKFLRPIEDSD